MTAADRLVMSREDECTCFHLAREHDRRCRALDSYGQPCGCPSFERDSNTREHLDDDFNESDPDNREQGQP